MSLLDVDEHAVWFDCIGERLQGVLAVPKRARKVAVLVVVGGPQYRAGSHRQFVCLSRRLASAGWPVLRFDVRGMGDSSGTLVDFESSGADIAAAVQALRHMLPGIDRVVLWGLCDAASAALIDGARLPNVVGLVLLNPWARNAETFERVHLESYYGRRLLEPAFWRKLVSGRVKLAAAIPEFAGKVYRAAHRRVFDLRRATPAESTDFRERMAQALATGRRPVLVILSGRDLVGAEFLEFVSTHPKLYGLWSRPGVTRIDHPKADHTFSSRELRAAVEDATLVWLAREFAGIPA